MATFTGPRATTTFPTPQAIQAGTMQIARGYIDIAANPVANDIFQLCWVPAGFVCVGGFAYFADLDTNATETLEFNMGWAANGGAGTYDTLSAAGLGDFGVTNGDAFAIPSISPEVGNIVPLGGILSTGIFPFWTKKTLIQAKCIATCATFTAGRLSVVLHGDFDPSLAV